MPLTDKGSEILSHMEKEYGTEKGKEVFYASRNKGTISGVDEGGEDFITIEPKEGEFLTLPVHDEADAPKTELDVARAIMSGELPSPQPFENILLYDMRITGTGTSFRPKNNEHVYRPPENFLTEDFVARCNGLPVIFEHPPGSALDTEEYRERAVGTIILPYIKGDEVRGVARIYDMDAARLMETTHTSTSPAVIFRPHDGNMTVDLDDGSHLLIEGIPSYLDHLAICTEGVWDKGGTPTGIAIGDATMPETDKEVIKKGFEENTSGKEDKKDFGGREEKDSRKDEEANVPAWADALVKKVDSLCERMDTFDKKDRKDEKEEKEDRKDEEEKEEDRKKEDKKDRKDRKDETDREKGEEEERRAGKELEKGREEEKKDSRMDSLMRENAILDRLASVEVGVKSLSRELSHEEKDALAMAQSRADSLFLSLNEKLTAPLFGETPTSYRKRLASRLQKYSPKLKDVKLDSISDAATFEILEREIYADAAAAASSPAFLPEGKLFPEKFTDFANRVCTKYKGDIKAAFAPWVQRSVPFRVNTSLTSKK